jgi:uncharacterized caspase-like protein/surface antigen
MNTIDILDNGELALFIESLRLTGYDISTTEFFAAQDLMVALAAQGKLPKKLAPMKTLLMPIFCHSPKEQEDFSRHFDDWINRVESVKHDKKQQLTFLQSVWQDTKQAVKNLKWFLIFALFALILLSVFPTSFDIKEPIGDLNKIPETPSQQTQTPIDSEGSPSTIPTEPNPNLSDETKPTDNIDYFTQLYKDLTWWQWAILFLLPFGGLLWYLWQRYKAPPYLTRKSTSQTPNIKQFFAKDINEGLFQSVGLARVAQQLRKHTPITTDLLDLKATIKRTIKAGGWFTPVTGIAKTIPEYLVFIDRTTFKDHHSHFIDALVNQLIAQGVFVTRYYFDGDPRHCYPENDELPPLLLTELSDHYPTHRLLMFSDGKGFTDPITGDIVPWIEQFSAWTQKTFFTLEQPEQWGVQEKLLAAANFLVMPANENGLTTLAEQIKAEQWQPDTPYPKTKNFTAFPAYFNDFSQWWLERHAPDRAKVTELLKQVRDFLGEDGYYWFSACAVYPEIRWQLTVYLGYNLKATDGNQLLTNDRLPKLARLPWFRYGNMPNWLRKRLVDDLSLEQEKAVRTELNVLWAMASDKPISDFCLEIAHEQKAQLSKLGEQLLSKWIKYTPKNSLLRDYVFLSFMPLSKLAVKISNRLFTYPKMSMRAVGAVIAVSLLLLGILSFVFFERKPQYDQHALVVGINQYQHTNEQKLNNIEGAVNDAEVIRNALRNIEVQLPDKWVLLDANATRANFVRAWQDMVKQAKPGDTLIITFSGHGGQQTDTMPLDEKDNKDEILMFHDFNPQHAFQGRIIDDEIYGLFSKASVYKILFVVDAAFSAGMVVSRSIRSSGMLRTSGGSWNINLAPLPPLPLPSVHNEKMNRLTHVTVISAVEYDGMTNVREYTIEGKKHGALSWYFAQALSGNADGNKNGYLERDELEDFLAEKVIALTKGMQTPRVFPRADGQSVIRISSTPSVINGDGNLPITLAGCADYEFQVNQAVQNSDFETLEKLFVTLNRQTDCPVSYLDGVKRSMAQITAINAENLVQQGKLAEAETWLKRAPTMVWNTQVVYGEIAAHRKQWQNAADFFNQALDLMDDLQATPQAPTLAEIEKVYQLAQEAQLLAGEITPTPSLLEPKSTTITDKDNDTIPDNEDNCPNNTSEEISKGVRQRGSKKGCPVDGDNDGVPDYKDSCQDTLFGIKVDDKGCAIVAKESSDYHIVKRGETLFGIAVFYGQNYKEVARWNNISPPYTLSVGQKLRLSPPEPDSDGILDGAAGAVVGSRFGKGTGRVGGGAAGAVIGSRFGKGTGRDIAIVIGAVEGALLGGMIGESMDANDQVRTQQALNNTAIGQSLAWTNPDTQSQYEVTPVSTFNNKYGQNCRKYTIVAIIKGKRETLHGTACRQADGTWKAVDSDLAKKTLAKKAHSSISCSLPRLTSAIPIALVIANSKYTNGTIRQPINDAKAMKKVLEEIGFRVIFKTELNRRAMNKATIEFRDCLRISRGVGLFYFSGYGMQLRGKNYLLPININIKDKADVKYDAFPVDKMFDRLKSAENELNIIILDASRDNPYPKVVKKSGLTNVSFRNTLIAYPTEADKTIQNQRSRNSLYISTLTTVLKKVAQNHTRIEDVFMEVANQVEQKSGGQQIPRYQNSLKKKFCFGGCQTRIRGLTQMQVLRGSLVAFATSPGGTTADGEGENGFYTKHLLKVIRQHPYELRIEDLFSEIRNSVYQESGGEQEPWYQASLSKPFYGLAGKKDEELRRIALVIGNSNYDYSSLRNPINDAKDMANALKKLGFDVILITNANYQAMKAAFVSFKQKLRKSSEETVALFYFSGYGVQVEGEDFLIPIDNSNIKQEEYLKFKTVSAQATLAMMKENSTGMNIMIIDASRDNPYKGRGR